MSTDSNNANDRFVLAGRWLFRLQSDDLSHEEVSEWLRWFEEDPKNRAAFEEAQEILEAARSVPVEMRQAWSASLAATRPDRTMRRRPAEEFLSWINTNSALVAAASLTAVAIALAFSWSMSRDVRQLPMAIAYQTSLATHRNQSLADGSFVHLGARSSISLNFTAETRYVFMESGEAQFNVAKDPQRPFIVQAGATMVRAVGTEFNIRRAGASTTVAVSEGTVEVFRAGATDSSIIGGGPAIRVTAGEQVIVESEQALPTKKPVHVADVSAWKVGRLEFENEPLRSVIATVNRYSPREIVVTEPRLNDLRLTGTVESHQTGAWLGSLPEILPVRIVEVGRGAVLISPARD